MTKIAKSLGLLAFIYSVATVAQVSHVSINSRMFELGAYPRIRLNLITDNQDITRLEFVVHQSTGEEKLMAQQLNRFLILLTGVEDIKDPKAQLLVREYRVDRWYEVKSLPVFGTAKTPEPQVLAPKLEINPAVTSTHIAKPVGSSAAQIADADIESTAIAPSASSVALAVEECVLNYAANETLWRIANRYAAEWDVNVYGAMLAIYTANPRAFAKNKINALMKNAPLYCPSKDNLTRYADAGEAKAIFETKSGG